MDAALLALRLRCWMQGKPSIIIIDRSMICSALPSCSWFCRCVVGVDVDEDALALVQENCTELELHTLSLLCLYSFLFGELTSECRLTQIEMDFIQCTLAELPLRGTHATEISVHRQ